MPGCAGVPDEQVPDGGDAGGVCGGGHGQEEDGEAQADHCQVGQDCHPYLVVFGFSWFYVQRYNRTNIVML
jgi:hypothetical protein